VRIFQTVLQVRVPTYVKEREFDRLDRDGSGSLGLDEASLMPDVRLASIITHGVSALVHECDTDGDGALSADEIVAKAAVFAAAPGLPGRAKSAEELDSEESHDEL
jgi:Ca2+-binding EF-hand superfamily protein